jgi:hypothetical protein
MLDHLDSTLIRASRQSLDLTVEWPVKAELLSLISFRNSPIDALSLIESVRLPWMLGMYACNKLNLTALRTLSFNIELIKVPLFMDLALQSTQSQLFLKFEGNYPNKAILDHKLMKRVSRIHIDSSQSTIWFKGDCY